MLTKITKSLAKKGYYTIDLPSYWASYLINCDCSGMEEEEIELCDRMTKNLGNCVDVDTESFFGRYNGLGCDLSTYIFLKEPPKKSDSFLIELIPGKFVSEFQGPNKVNQIAFFQKNIGIATNFSKELATVYLQDIKKTYPAARIIRRDIALKQSKTDQA